MDLEGAMGGSGLLDIASRRRDDVMTERSQDLRKPPSRRAQDSMTESV